ncbi:hypothetical protein Lalb_Chr18g0050391 [Lupinus albus]|uniref:Transcription factor WD40-like family n=1 Tax=Lupinus albus TaxID=3870 RepID=A0A6A4P4Z8_LUPAL|nr:hypothetical protein Lalb_Chr18g0050391 [Lupinus albus]
MHSSLSCIKIWEDHMRQPLVVLRPHDGNPVFSATFLPAPYRPDHIVLITGGPQNREVKLWVSSWDEDWMVPGDAESWKCTQTLELKSSAQPCLRDAFFNQIAALPHAGLLLLANAQRNAIYALHLHYGSNPEYTRMDYVAEFTVTMPILSFTGTHDISPQGEHIVHAYCVQTQAIQQYALDLALCLPPPLENMGLEKSGSIVSRDSFAGRTSEMPLSSSAPKTVVQATSTESAHMAKYPFRSDHIEASASKQSSSSNAEAKPVTLAPSGSDADIVCVSCLPLPLGPRLSRKLSDFRNPRSNLGDQIGEQSFDEYSVDRQMNTIHSNLSDVPPLNNDSKIDEKKVKQNDISSVLNPSVMFKQPAHLVTPSEIIKAGSSSETSIIDIKSDCEAKIQDLIDVGNTEVKVKVVGEANSDQSTEFDQQGPQQYLFSDSKEKLFCSQASDLGIEMAGESFSTSGEAYISGELGVVDCIVRDSLAQPSNVGEDDLHEAEDIHKTLYPNSLLLLRTHFWYYGSLLKVCKTM